MSRVIHLLHNKVRAPRMKQNIRSTIIVSIIIGLILTSANFAFSSADTNSSDSTWKLNISGLVNHPSNFMLADLQAMPQTTVSTALICVDFPTTIVAQGNWTGVNLWTLLNTTGVSPEAIKIAFYANDGYTTDLTVATVSKSDNIILAYAKDGVPLSEVLQLVVPGHWGYKWITKVEKIELVNYDFQGRWESQGYTDDGIITPSSQKQTHPYPSAPVLTTPVPTPIASPKATPNPTLSTSPIPNSTSQSPSTEPKNLTSGNFNLNETTLLIPIIIIAIAVATLITIIKIKNNRKKNYN
jgi:hypothetical protein